MEQVAPGGLAAVVADARCYVGRGGRSDSAVPVTLEGRERLRDDREAAGADCVAVATATETLFAIGAGTQVVAVDNQSNYPANAR